MLRPLLTFLIALAGLGSFQALGGAFGHSIAGVSKGAPLAMATGGDTVRPPSPRRGADPVPASSAQAALIPRGSALHEVRALVKSHGERWISLYESAPAAERALVEQNLVEVFARVQKDQRTQQLVRPLIGDGELTVRTGIHHALRNVLKTDTGEVSDFSSLERVLVAGYEALSPTDRMRLLLDAIAAADDGERLGAVLYRLGPGYVKLGQILSSRADLVRGRHAVTLQKLTDDVPPVPEALIQKVLDDHRGALHEKLGTAPTLGARLATGSVGQTHLLHVNDQRY
ncbi:MAG: hypothetical protein KC416_15590, partial [Myxococcales bacterium]|nr:hypothetical protein [Myxococcales bacterium]